MRSKTLSATLLSFLMTSGSWGAQAQPLSRNQCDRAVSQISSLHRMYAEASLKSKSTTAKKIVAELNQILRQSEQSKAICHQEILKTHLISALENSASFDFGRFGVERTAEIEPLVSHNLGIVAMARLLISQNKVTFLTELTRKGLGPSWTQAKNSKYQLQGAYSCQDSQVYIDPNLAPLDLAAIFVHELDHLFRDKLIDPKWMAQQLDSGSLDWRHFVLIDEAVASSTAAFMQRQKLEGRYWRQQSLGLRSEMKAYNVAGDLTLFKRGGPVDELVGICDLAYEPLASFLGRTLLQRDRKESVQSVPYSDAIFVLLDSGYFPGDAGLDFRMIEPAKLALEFSPLARFLGELEGSRNPTILNQRIAAMSELLKSHLSSPSQQCKGFQQALKTPALAGYAGRQVQVRNEGTHGGETGVHPGEAGVHPGETGVHPDEVGVHPGESGVHPCLNLDHGI